MTIPSPPNERVRVRSVTTLSDNWYVLRKFQFDFRRTDGSWQSLEREAYDRGNGAAILLYNRARGTVVLTRQFRLPTFVNGNPDGMLLEVPAGLLDADTPEEAIRREVAEETGFRVGRVVPVLQAYMSPGSVTERLHLFVAEFDPGERAGEGGGSAAEGEDIEVLEVRLADALAMIVDGAIMDAKTIMLLYHARIIGLLDG